VSSTKTHAPTYPLKKQSTKKVSLQQHKCAIHKCLTSLLSPDIWNFGRKEFAQILIDENLSFFVPAQFGILVKTDDGKILDSDDDIRKWLAFLEHAGYMIQYGATGGFYIYPNGSSGKYKQIPKELRNNVNILQKFLTSFPDYYHKFIMPINPYISFAGENKIAL